MAEAKTESSAPESKEELDTFITEVDGQGEVSLVNGRKRDLEDIANDLMMLLDTSKLEDLRKEFEKSEKGLGLEEFLLVMMRFLRESIAQDDVTVPPALRDEVELVASLKDMFEQIDVNGDATMEWDEFTSFIIDSGVSGPANDPVGVEQYLPSAWEDTHKHVGIIEQLYYWPECDIIATCERGSRALHMYRAEDMGLALTITRLEGDILAAAFVPETNEVATSSSDLQISVHDQGTGKMRRSFHVPSSQTCLLANRSDAYDRPTLFSAGVNGIIFVWDLVYMEERMHWGGLGRDGRPSPDSHTDIVLTLLQIPSLNLLVSGGMDGTIRLWNTATGKPGRVLRGHQKGVRALAYNEEYRFLVSAGFDYEAIVWNPYVEKLIMRLHGHTSPLCGVHMIPGTPQMITADQGASFKVWDIRNFGCVQSFTPEGERADQLASFAPAPRHKRIVSGGRQLHVFDYERQKNPHLTDDQPIQHALFNPLTMHVMTAGASTVKVWDVLTGELKKVFRGVVEGDITALTLDGRNCKFLCGTHSGIVSEFTAVNGAFMKDLGRGTDPAHSSEVSGLAYSVRHKCVVSASWDRTIVVHDDMDNQQGILLRDISHAHTADIACMALSDHLSLIATGAVDGSVHVWDFELLRLEGTCLAHTSPLTHLRFLDPYPLLLSCDAAGNVCIWGVRPAGDRHTCLLHWVNTTAPPQVARSAVQSSAVDWEWELAVEEEEEESGHDAASPAVDGASQPGVSPRPLDDDPAFCVVSRYELYLGDDSGTVTGIDLLPLLTRLASPSVADAPPRRRPVPCNHSRRNLPGLDATRLVRTAYRKPNALAYVERHDEGNIVVPPSQPRVSRDDVELPTLASFRAHSETVYTVQCISQPPSLLTSSFDRMAALWSRRGACLGAFRQAIKPDPGEWRFQPDLRPLAVTRRQEAEALLERINAQERASARHHAQIAPPSPTASNASDLRSPRGRRPGKISTSAEPDLDPEVMRALRRGSPASYKRQTQSTRRSHRAEPGAMPPRQRMKPVKPSQAGRNRSPRPSRPDEPAVFGAAPSTAGVAAPRRPGVPRLHVKAAQAAAGNQKGGHRTGPTSARPLLSERSKLLRGSVRQKRKKGSKRGAAPAAGAGGGSDGKAAPDTARF